MAMSASAKRILTLFSKGSTRRMLSTSPQADAFFVIGKDGLITLPGDKWEDEDDYYRKNPMWQQVGILCTLNPEGPSVELTDAGRELLKSGAAVPYNARKAGVAICNPFIHGNVGVVKGTNILGFKVVKKDVLNSWEIDRSSGYKDWNRYWKQAWYGSESMSEMPAELYGYSGDLDSVADSEDEHFILHHCTHMDDLKFAELAIEVYRILMKESPLLPGTVQDKVILTAIGRKNSYMFPYCDKHPIVRLFYPPQIQQILKGHNLTSPHVRRGFSLGPYLNGVMLIEVLRHGCVHCVEERTVDLVNSLFPNKVVFTRTDVIRLLRHYFPNGLRDALSEFKTVHPALWRSLLQLDLRDPIRYI